MKIMVVDDEPDVLLVGRTVLEKEGYEVIDAHNGEDCLEILKTENPDLILLDVMMPGIDGFEVCKRIKNDTKTKDIPIIILSAKGGEEDVLKGMSLGIADYFPKPFSYDILLGKIDSIFKTKKAEEELERVTRRGLDREIRMLSLKEQIKDLKSELEKLKGKRDED